MNAQDVPPDLPKSPVHRILNGHMVLERMYRLLRDPEIRMRTLVAILFS